MDGAIVPTGFNALPLRSAAASTPTTTSTSDMTTPASVNGMTLGKKLEAGITAREMIRASIGR